MGEYIGIYFLITLCSGTLYVVACAIEAHEYIARAFLYALLFVFFGWFLMLLVFMDHMFNAYAAMG